MSGTKREQIGVTVPQGAKLRLEAIAKQFQFHRGTQVSISALLTAIADGTLLVGPPLRLDEAHSGSLANAAAALSVQGDYEDARLLCALLREHGTLSDAEWQRVRQLRLTAPEEWWTPLRQHIAEERPFEIRGLDLLGVERSWTVRHASLSRFNRHGYLDVWSEESEGNATNVETLSHNWVIPVAAVQSVLPTGGSWRGCFDKVEATIVIYPFCIPGEEVAALQTTNGEVRTINIHSAFHAVREWLSWGLPVEVVGPPSLKTYWLQHRQLSVPPLSAPPAPAPKSRLERQRLQHTLRTWITEDQRPTTAKGARPLVRTLERETPANVVSAYEALRPANVPSIVGTGTKLTASAPQSATRRLGFDDDVTAEIELQWVKTMSIRYRLHPARPDALLILAFEEEDSGTPLSIIGLPGHLHEQSVSITAKELGFDPTSRPWRYWAVLV